MPLWGKLGLAGVVLLGAASIGTYSYVRSYIGGDAFREKLAISVGDFLKGDAEFEQIKWSGWTATTDRFSLKNGQGAIGVLEGKDLKAELDIGAAWGGLWKVDRLYIKHADYTEDLSAADQPYEKKGKPLTGLLKTLLPDKTEVREIEVGSLNAVWKSNGGDYSLRGAHAVAELERAPSTYGVELKSGDVTLPLELLPTAKLHSGKFVVDDEGIKLERSIFQVFRRAVLNLSGNYNFEDAQYAFEGDISDLEMREVIPEDWSQKLSGDLQSSFKLTPYFPNRNKVVAKGQLELTNGQIVALPILDTLAAYTNTAEFRSLDLTRCDCSYVYKPDEIKLRNIHLHSGGLVRLEGSLDIQGRNLDGKFNLGLRKGVLSHIPGAETKVFKDGKDGMLWTPLRITGTMDDPKEDLTNRLIQAAGERLFEMVPETGEKVLKFTKGLSKGLLSGNPIGEVAGLKELAELGLDTRNGGAGVIGGVLGSVLGGGNTPAKERGGGTSKRDPSRQPDIDPRRVVDLHGYTSVLPERWEKNPKWMSGREEDGKPLHCAKANKYNKLFVKAYAYKVYKNAREFAELEAKMTEGGKVRFHPVLSFSTKSGIKGYTLKATHADEHPDFGKNWVRYRIFLELEKKRGICYEMHCRTVEFSSARSGFEIWVRSVQDKAKAEAAKKAPKEAENNQPEGGEKAKAPQKQGPTGSGLLPINPFGL